MGTSGQLGRAILAYHLSFVISVSQPGADAARKVSRLPVGF